MKRRRGWSEPETEKEGVTSKGTGRKQETQKKKGERGDKTGGGEITKGLRRKPSLRGTKLRPMRDRERTNLDN